MILNVVGANMKHIMADQNFEIFKKKNGVTFECQIVSMLYPT